MIERIHKNKSWFCESNNITDKAGKNEKNKIEGIMLEIKGEVPKGKREVKYYEQLYNKTWKNQIKQIISQEKHDIKPDSNRNIKLEYTCYNYGN